MEEERSKIYLILMYNTVSNLSYNYSLHVSIFVLVPIDLSRLKQFEESTAKLTWL